MNIPIIISGGGLIGNYISLRLRRSGIQSKIIERNDELYNSDSGIRTITLNPKSVELLQYEGIKIASSSIKNIYAYDADGTGKINFSSDDIDSNDLSKVVMFNELNSALKEQNISNTLYETQIDGISYNSNIEKTEINLSDSSIYKTDLLVACDGKALNVAKIYGFKNTAHSYNQTAATFLVKADTKATDAHQIFSDKGIFALMPAPKGENIFTVVWSLDNKFLDTESLDAYIHSNLGHFEKKLGCSINIQSDILSFKLSSHYIDSYIKDSVVLLADSAHSIHPLAGQGVNLGFADADVFCNQIEQAFHKGLKINEQNYLKKYSIEREALNLIMLKSMDLFVNIFKNDNPYLRLARNLGLNYVNKSKLAKVFFIGKASGF